MTSARAAIACAAWIALAAAAGAAHAQGRIVVRDGTLRVESGGAVNTAGGVTVAGPAIQNPKLELVGTAFLRLGSGATLSVGDGTDPGKLSASGTTPTITTTGTAGSTFYAFTVTSWSSAAPSTPPIG